MIQHIEVSENILNSLESVILMGTDLVLWFLDDFLWILSCYADSRFETVYLHE